MDFDREDTTVYRAVVNHEEQYSIWPVDRELPLGWNDAGKVGLKDEVLAWIREVWTDMRPLSLRKKMEEMAAEEERRRNGGHAPREPDRYRYRAVKRPDGFYILIPFHDQAFAVEPYVSSGWEDTGIQGTEAELEALIERGGGVIVSRYRDADVDGPRYRAFKRPDGLHVLMPPGDGTFAGKMYIAAGWQDTGITGTEQEVAAVIERGGGVIVQRYREP
jgi:MbtH protein